MLQRRATRRSTAARRVAVTPSAPTRCPGSTSVASNSSARSTTRTRSACSSPTARDGSPVGLGDRHAAQHAVRPDHLRDGRERRDEHRRDAHPFDLLRQRCPATRACASGAGEDHGLHARVSELVRDLPPELARDVATGVSTPTSCRTCHAARRSVPRLRARAPRRAAPGGSGRRSRRSCRTRRAPTRRRRPPACRRRRAGSGATRSRDGSAAGPGCPAARIPPR